MSFHLIPPRFIMGGQVILFAGKTWSGGRGGGPLPEKTSKNRRFPSETPLRPRCNLSKWSPKPIGVPLLCWNPRWRRNWPNPLVVHSPFTAGGRKNEADTTHTQCVLHFGCARHYLGTASRGCLYGALDTASNGRRLPGSTSRLSGTRCGQRS